MITIFKNECKTGQARDPEAGSNRENRNLQMDRRPNSRGQSSFRHRSVSVSRNPAGSRPDMPRDKLNLNECSARLGNESIVSAMLSVMEYPQQHE